MRYENEDGRNKSDVGGSSESFLKAPRVTRQVYAETSIIPVTYFIASWANSSSPVLQHAASLFSPFTTQPLSLRAHPPDGLARSRPRRGSPTFLFLIDSSSAFYTSSFSSPWLFSLLRNLRLHAKSTRRNVRASTSLHSISGCRREHFFNVTIYRDFVFFETNNVKFTNDNFRIRIFLYSWMYDVTKILFTSDAQMQCECEARIKERRLELDELCGYGFFERHGIST